MPALPQQLDEIKKDQSRKNKIFSSEFCSCVQLAAELAAVSRDNCSCCVAGAADCCSCGRFRTAKATVGHETTADGATRQRGIAKYQRCKC